MMLLLNIALIWDKPNMADEGNAALIYSRTV